MNEQLTRHVLSEARRSMEPSTNDRDLVLKRVLMTAAAASVAGGAAAAAKASGASGVVSMLFKGATVIKLGAAFLMVTGGVALWMFTMEPVSLPPATDAKSVVSTEAPAARNTLPATAPDVAVMAPEPTDMLVPPPIEAVPAVATQSTPELQRHHGEHSGAVSQKESSVTADADDGDDALYREISAMKHASAALRDNNPEEALRILEKFEKSDPNGVMAEEREGIRVLALCATGPSDRATAAEKRFLTHAPNSPMAARIRRACAVKEPE